MLAMYSVMRYRVVCYLTLSLVLSQYALAMRVLRYRMEYVLAVRGVMMPYCVQPMRLLCQCEV